jgi:adenylate cyclase
VASLRDLIRFDRSRSVQLPGWLDRVISLGIVTDDPKIARRQKIVNVASYAAAFNSMTRLIAAPFHEHSGLVDDLQLTSGGLALAALLVNRMHLFGENAAAVALVGWFLCSVSFAAYYFGAGYVQVYFVLIGVLWFLFGLEHWRMSVVWSGIVFAAAPVIIFYAPKQGAAIGNDAGLATYVALQSLINAIVIISIVIVYALLLLQRAERDLERQSARAEALVDVVLPRSIAEQLRANPETRIADRIEGVTLLFADLVAFTPVAHGEPPERVVAYLDEFVRASDAMCQAHGVEKIKSIGDGYMVAGGLNGNPRESAIAIGKLALEMLKAQERRPPLAGRKLQLRIGIHCGTVIAGVIGNTRISYDLWGDAVNFASRLQSQGVPGRIHVSEKFCSVAAGAFEFEPHGLVDIRGVGPAKTFFLAAPRWRARLPVLDEASQSFERMDELPDAMRLDWAASRHRDCSRETAAMHASCLNIWRKTCDLQ